MQGKKEIIEALNELLAGELSAMDLYLLQGRMCRDWGYSKLEERLVHESADERGHADALIERILFLEGEPDLASRLKLSVGKNPQEMLENDLAYELDVASNLNRCIQLCVREGDGGSRALLERLLQDTEDDHIFWLESQLSVIEEIGKPRYLAEQM